MLDGLIIILLHAFADRVAAIKGAYPGYGQWDKADLTALATSKNGVKTFEMLLDLSLTMYSPKAPESMQEEAAAALKALSPKGPDDYIAYALEIRAVGKETIEQRKAIPAEAHFNSVHDLYVSPMIPKLKPGRSYNEYLSKPKGTGFVAPEDLSPDVGLNRVEDKAFDQQAEGDGEGRQLGRLGRVDLGRGDVVPHPPGLDHPVERRARPGRRLRGDLLGDPLQVAAVERAEPDGPLQVEHLDHAGSGQQLAQPRGGSDRAVEERHGARCCHAGPPRPIKPLQVEPYRSSSAFSTTSVNAGCG